MLQILSAFFHYISSGARYIFEYEYFCSSGKNENLLSFIKIRIDLSRFVFSLILYTVCDIMKQQIEKEEALPKLRLAVQQKTMEKSDLDEIVSRAQEEAKLMGAPRPFSDEELKKLIKEIFA